MKGRFVYSTGTLINPSSHMDPLTVSHCTLWNKIISEKNNYLRCRLPLIPLKNIAFSSSFYSTMILYYATLMPVSDILACGWMHQKLFTVFNVMLDVKVKMTRQTIKVDESFLFVVICSFINWQSSCDPCRWIVNIYIYISCTNGAQHIAQGQSTTLWS